MDRNRQKGCSLHPERHRLWMGILRGTRATPQNDELLTAYFLRECAGCPEELEQFLRRLRLSLLRRPESGIALQYLRVLSPLAERFGLFTEKNALDTLCFRTTDPMSFEDIRKRFSRSKRESVSIVARITKRLRSLLLSSRVEADISGRYKHLYSIFRKLKAKRYRLDFSLSDIFAFRIILAADDPKGCFDVLNLLHDTFMPVADRFKDYISIPKVNGYQSLHTVLTGVVDGFDLPVEVQIRTRSMHEFSEHGLASHWFYARSKRTQVPSNEHRLLEHYRGISKDLRREDISLFCMTPRGDLLPFRPGSTVRDFAMSIHTDLARRMTAATVNGRRVMPDHRLDHGDRVCILKASSDTLHAS